MVRENRGSLHYKVSKGLTLDGEQIKCSTWDVPGAQPGTDHCSTKSRSCAQPGADLDY